MKSQAEEKRVAQNLVAQNLVAQDEAAEQRTAENPAPTPVIVVTGATGNVGEWVVRGLLKRGARVRVAVRDPEGAKQRFGPRADYVRLEFGEEGTYEQAFAGAQALFLIRPPQIADVARKIIPALKAAKLAGVERVVFLSLQGAERNKVVPHRRVEDHLKAHGPAWTFLRPSFFMQNLSTTHRRDIAVHDEIFVPAGAGRTSFIDVRDVAAVAVTALTEPGHTFEAYELTGEAFNYTRAARILSAVLNRPIAYANPSPWRFWRRMRGYGYPAGYVGVMLALYTACRFGLAARVTPEAARLLGRAPLSFEQFARDYADCWQKPAAVPSTGEPEPAERKFTESEPIEPEPIESEPTEPAHGKTASTPKPEAT